MASAMARLVQRCEDRGRDSEPVQESVARLLRTYDDASPAQRRALYGRALYVQYGLFLEAMAHDRHLLQEMCGDEASMMGAATGTPLPAREGALGE